MSAKHAIMYVTVNTSLFTKTKFYDEQNNNLIDSILSKIFWDFSKSNVPGKHKHISATISGSSNMLEKPLFAADH